MFFHRGLGKRWICIVTPLPSLETKIKKINRKCCHCSTEGQRWQWRMPSLWLPTIFSHGIFQTQDLISYVNSISRFHINAGITCLLLCVTGGTVRQSHNQRRICLAGGGRLAVAGKLIAIPFPLRFWFPTIIKTRQLGYKMIMWHVAPRRQVLHVCTGMAGVMKLNVKNDHKWSCDVTQRSLYEQKPKPKPKKRWLFPSRWGKQGCFGDFCASTMGK